MTWGGRLVAVALLCLLPCRHRRRVQTHVIDFHPHCFKVPMAIHSILRRAMKAAALITPSPAVRRASSTAAPRAQVPGVEATTPDTEGGSIAPGRFIDRTYKNDAGTRAFKLYVPANVTEQAAGVLVMLHGCRQDPEDFAAGTLMNRLADRHGFVVAYPAQSMHANGMRCWELVRPRQSAQGPR